MLSLLKRTLFILLFIISLAACKQQSRNTSEETTKAPIETAAKGSDSLLTNADSSLTKADTPGKATDSASLALTSNGLQVVNSTTGSTTALAFGLPLNQLVDMVENVLHIKVKSIQTNSECGAGPLKMAAWSNGLTLVFQDKDNQDEWTFEGWFISTLPNPLPKVTTMASIGVGSTRAEMESAYKINVTKTSLGHEFSTSSGLFGIFSGPGKDASITDMWGGLSCNFR